LEQRDIIETFAYTGFTGPIRMNNPDNQFVVFEDYDLNAPTPKRIHLGRLVAESGRKAINKYTLKKRKYIATTSMDAELSLVTANLALASCGKLCYDPFMGTGSFPLACAHFGAAVYGSDLDGRSIRGKNGRNVHANFEQYGTSSLYLGGLVADLTNSPLRPRRYLDAILCDPPYGVREGLKVLGSNKRALQSEVFLEDGSAAHLGEAYVPPKKAYSFLRMLGDILDFSATMLVDGGRLCMWMPVAGPTAEDDDPEATEEYAIPQHPALELVSECTQHFNKWSRRLLTYQRRMDSDIDQEEALVYQAARSELQSGNAVGTADDLNSFRRKVRLMPFISG
jgi:tRNA (guanine10-N2)-methyltransferase